MILTKNDYALFFKDDKLLSSIKENSYIIPYLEIARNLTIPLTEQDCFFLERVENKNIFVVFLSEPLPENSRDLNLIPMRDALAMADGTTSQFISRGKHLLHWHRSSLYCGCCGAPTQISPIETAKICQSCNRVFYPVTHPVIIVLIERDNRVLLARSPHFAQGMYSALAGFIDAGESCEATIYREVEEEVGLQVKEISYFGSQAWPFPHSIIMGFRAQYAGGEIKTDPKEIEDAQWFDISDLPTLPHPCSIARHMIDHYVAQSKHLS